MKPRGCCPSIEFFSRVFRRRYRFSSSSRLKFRALLMDRMTLSMDRGFSNQIKGTELGGFNGCFDGAVPGDDDDLNVGVAFFNLLQCFDAIDSGHPDIQQHQVRRFFVDYFQCFISIGCGDDLKSFIRQEAAEGFEDGGFVVNDQVLMETCCVLLLVLYAMVFGKKSCLALSFSPFFSRLLLHRQIDNKTAPWGSLSCTRIIPW